jgi:hypothetical protein
MIKRVTAARLSVAIVVLLLAGCIVSLHPHAPGVVVYAQTVPTIVHAQWAPNAAADNVTGYTVVVDGGAPLAVPAALDATCSCIQAPLSLSTFGSHTVSVTASNLLLSSDPASGQQSGTPTVVTFALNKSPAAVGGAVVKK